ncbi:MAG: hypothetical protein ABIJ56_05265 [Pseudomonadota bacterium]
MIEIVKKYLLLHRICALAKSLLITSTPVILAGSVLLLLHKFNIIETSERIAVPIIIIAAAILWIPAYIRWRGSLLGMAKKADSILDSKGIITAGTDIASTGEPRSLWGRLVEAQGAEILSATKTGRIIPPKRYMLFLPFIVAVAMLVLTVTLPRLSAEIKRLDWDDEDKLKTSLHLFNAADEKLLKKIQEKLRKDFDQAGAEINDEKLSDLKKEVKKALSAFPENEEELDKYMKNIEELKKKLKEIEKENSKELEVLKEIGEEMDGKLLKELGEKLKEQNLEEAADQARKLGEQMEGSQPSSKQMEEAAGDLQEGRKEGQNKLGEKMAEAGSEGDKKDGDQQGDKKDGDQQGDKQQGDKAGQEGSKDGSDGQGMDKDKFDKLKKALEQMNKLAEMFGNKSENIPEGMKDLGKELSDMDMSHDQAKELQDMIKKLENLKSMMVDAKGAGKKNQYSDLRKQFENNASGKTPPMPGHEGHEGSDCPCQGGATPGGKKMMPGEGKDGGSMQEGSGKQGGQGKQGGPENPGDQPAAADDQGGQSEGQEGWGDGSAPHLGDAQGDGDAGYDDMDLEGKDNPGPLKKDIIKGAGKGGFVGKNYKQVYEEYSSIVEEIMEEENVPTLYRYYINKYFELIAPREEE